MQRAVTIDAGFGALPQPHQPPRTVPLRSRFAIDESPTLIQRASTPAGRVLLFSVFGVLLACSTSLRLAAPVVLGAALVAFSEAARAYALLAATLLALLLDPQWYTVPSFETFLLQHTHGAMLSPRMMQRVATFAMFALSLGLLRYVRVRPKSWLALHPVVCMLSGIALATGGELWLLALGYDWQAAWLAIAIKIAAAYIWFICYAIVDQRALKAPALAMSLGTFRPFWGSYSPPIGKGAAYLAKFRCRDARELAVTQLKALKLLVWSIALYGLSFAVQRAAGQLGIPDFERLLDGFVHGEATPIGVGWLALIIATAIAAIELAAWGHQFVACARLAGFKLRRNTVRPLRSRNLADFWNRYYFYFKELLVDFFFYPTFLRCFKERPKLRVFFATFMAAGVGNAIHHFVRDIDLLFTMGPGAAVTGFSSYLLYCTLLALGIGVSQARTESEPAPVQSATLARRASSILFVWGFVMCLHPFGLIEARNYTLQQRCSFMLHQLGL